jgi:hypothetical protein
MATKVLLRSRETGLYYDGRGAWIPLGEGVAEFQSIREAVKAYWADGLIETEVVLRSDRLDPAARVPVQTD